MKNRLSALAKMAFASAGEKLDKNLALASSSSLKLPYSSASNSMRAGSLGGVVTLSGLDDTLVAMPVSCAPITRVFER